MQRRFGLVVAGSRDTCESSNVGSYRATNRFVEFDARFEYIIAVVKDEIHNFTYVFDFEKVSEHLG